MSLIHVLAAAALATSFGAWAQSGPASGADPAAHRAPAASAALQSDGEVRKVDREQGKVTLRHGPLPNLEMPAMTMVFTAADPKLLDGLKEGDKVKFTADKVNGVFTVTAIQVAK